MSTIPPIPVTAIPGPQVPRPAPFPYAEPQTYFLSPSDAAAGTVVPGSPPVALGVASFDVPDQIPALNELLSTGRWAILLATENRVLVQRVALDPEEPQPVAPVDGDGFVGDRVVDETPGGDTPGNERRNAANPEGVA